MANTPARRKWSARSAGPVVNQVRDWLAAKDAQDALIRKWQDAEHRLSIRIKPLGLSPIRASRGDLPETRSMRALMRRIRAADRKLGREAGQIALMQATSPSGALAKIEMALRIQQPSNREDPFWKLLRDGVEQLRGFLAAGPISSPDKAELSASCEAGLGEPVS